MNQRPRFDSPISETSVRDHYQGIAHATTKLIWRRRPLVLTVIGVGLLLGFAGLVFIKKRYTADAMIQLTFSREDTARTGASSQAAGPAVEASALVESEARVLRSRAIARRVVEQLGLANDPAFAPSEPFAAHIESWLPGSLQPAGASQTDSEEATIRKDLIALALMRSLTVTNDTRSYLINISYTSGDAAISANIVNAFTEEYLRNNMEAGVNASRRTSDWIAQQIRETRASLDEAEAAVNASRRQSRPPGIEGGTSQQLQDLTTRLDEAKANRLAEDAKLAHAKNVFASDGVPSAQDLAEAPVIKKLLESRDDLRRELAELSRNDPEHPNLARARSDLDETEARLRAEIDGAIDKLASAAKAAAGAEAGLAASVQQIKDSAIDAKKRESQLKSLQLDAVSLRDRLKVLADGYTQSLSATGLTSANAQVVMRAEAIPLPSGPNPFVILGIALFGSAAFGIGLAHLLERRQTGFRSEVELAAETRTTCLGMVPDLPRQPRPRDLRIFDEAIGLVAASIEAHALAASNRVILVTSSIPKEGKSKFSRALAKAMARQGLRTLVIDTSAPNVSGAAKPARSLDEALMGNPKDYLRRLSSDTAVCLQASSRFAIADHDSTDRLAAFIQEAKLSFDLVVLEAPPVMLTLDFVSLARSADAVVLLARWGRTPRETVLAAVKRLDALSIRVCGLVLSGVNLKSHKEYFFVDQCSHYWSYRKYYDLDELKACPTAEPSARVPVLSS